MTTHTDPSSPSTDAASSRWRSVANKRLLVAAIGPLLYVGMSFALMSGAWAHPSSILIGNGGDPPSYLWDLQWPAFALSHGFNPFFTFYLVAPHGTNLAWGGSLGPGILLAPFISLIGPVVLYNLLATLSLAVSAWFAQLAIYRLVPSRIGSICGAIFFGFSPYMMGHAWGHLTITMAFLPPLMLIALHEALCRQRWRFWVTGTFAGLLFAYQFVTFIETDAIVAVAMVIAAVSLIVMRPRLVRERWWYAFRASIVTGVVFLVAAAYPLRTLLFGAQRLGHGTVQNPESFVTDLVNFVVPTVTTKFIPSFLANTSTHITNGVESGGYVGAPILLVCIVTVVLFWRQIIVRVAAITAIVLMALSLGPRLRVDNTLINIPMPFAFLEHLPFMGNILAARFMGVADLCLGVLIAVFVARLCPARPRWKVPGSALVAVGFLAIVPAPLPMPIMAYSIPTYFTSHAVQKIPLGSTALVAPFDTSGADIAPQLWQAASGFRFKMPEGYVYVPSPGGPITGPLPSVLGNEMSAIELAAPGATVPEISRAARRAYRADLRAWGISTVLVGPMANESNMVKFFTALLRRPGVSSGGIYAWYGVA